MFLDSALFDFFHGFAGISGILDVFFVFLAKYLAVIIVAAALVFFLRYRSKKERIYAILFSSLATLLSRGFITEGIRFFYEKKRPFEVLHFTPFFDEMSPSFPSGHSAFLFAIAFSVWYFDKKTGWWLVFAALLNGIGRIVTGMHWPNDILGGAIIAAVSILIVKKIIGPYAPVSRGKEESLERDMI